MSIGSALSTTPGVREAGLQGSTNQRDLDALVSLTNLRARRNAACLAGALAELRGLRSGATSGAASQTPGSPWPVEPDAQATLTQMVLATKRLEARGAILAALEMWLSLVGKLPPGEEQDEAHQVCRILSTLHIKVTE